MGFLNGDFDIKKMSQFVIPVAVFAPDKKLTIEGVANNGDV
jgi:hypothetical protein